MANIKIMSCILTAIILLISIADAHTWIEQMSLISSNGSFTGGYGYPRGYIGRTDPGFVSQSYLIPELDTGRTRVNASDLLCPPYQRSQNQPANYPRLTVAPGSTVAIKYLENGHVSLPQNQPGKPPMGGTVFMFGTTQPYDDETIVDVLQWTRDGSGGDKRGFLLGANNYDDGRCRQINGGAISLQRQAEFPNPIPNQAGTNVEIWCENDLVMPTDTTIMQAGQVLTIYWLWQWPTEPNTPGLPDGKDEYYSTCADFNVVAEVADTPLSNFLVQQDPNTVPVSGWQSRSAITPTPNVALATDLTWATSSWATSVPYTTSGAAEFEPTAPAGVSPDLISSYVPSAPESTPTPTLASSSSGADITTTSTITSTLYSQVTSTLSYSTYDVPLTTSDAPLPASIITTPISTSASSTSITPSASNSLDGILQGSGYVPVTSSYSYEYSSSTVSTFTTVYIPTSSILSSFDYTPTTSTPLVISSATQTSSLMSSIESTPTTSTPLAPSSTTTTTLASSANPLAGILGGGPSSASTSSPLTSATSALSHHYQPTATTSPLPDVAGDTPLTLTALVTVIATLVPGQTKLIVEGKHIVTFTAPGASVATST